MKKKLYVLGIITLALSSQNGFSNPTNAQSVRLSCLPNQGTLAFLEPIHTCHKVIPEVAAISARTVYYKVGETIERNERSATVGCDAGGVIKKTSNNKVYCEHSLPAGRKSYRKLIGGATGSISQVAEGCVVAGAGLQTSTSAQNANCKKTFPAVSRVPARSEYFKPRVN